MLDKQTVAAAFSTRTPHRLAGGLLVGLGALFALLWLSEIVPAACAGGALPSAVDAGLVGLAAATKLAVSVRLITAIAPGPWGRPEDSGAVNHLSPVTANRP